MGIDVQKGEGIVLIGIGADIVVEADVYVARITRVAGVGIVILSG